MMNQIIKVNNELFLIKRITNEMYEKAASTWNEMSINHKTFKKEGQMYFCELIEEAQIIEENINNLKIEN
jgi:hypothetical protein